MDPNFPKQGQKYLEGRYKSSTLHFKSNEFQIKRKGHLRIQFRPRVTGALGTGIKYPKSWTGGFHSAFFILWGLTQV